MIRTVAVGSGALCMSSERLVDELKSVKKATAYRVEAAMAIANGGFVRPEALRNKKSTNLPAMKMQGARGSVGFAEVGLGADCARLILGTPLRALEAD